MFQYTSIWERKEAKPIDVTMRHTQTMPSHHAFIYP